VIGQPYVYFGGKQSVVPPIFQRLGYTPNFIDPFFGGGSALWMNPAFDWYLGNWKDKRTHIETVNDIDGYVSNFWRAVKNEPSAVAAYADNPVNEIDLHARHIWLVEKKNSLPDYLMGNPDYYDAKIAGYWVWGISVWLGGGFCSGKGPWISKNGIITKKEQQSDIGISRQLPSLSNAGQGVTRRRSYLSNAGQSMTKERAEHLICYFSKLRDRLRNVRVTNGDWKRVMTPSVTTRIGLTGMILDPPYNISDRTMVYSHDSVTMAADVIVWATDNGDNKLFRIALCGYDNYDMPANWERYSWQARGGLSTSNNDNRKRETIWFSPHCLKPNKQLSLL